jgi:Protein of unknown function DUF86
MPWTPSGATWPAVGSATASSSMLSASGSSRSARPIKAISPELLDAEPGHPWSDIARMRDRLAHRYFDTNHGHVAGAVEHDLEPLTEAVLRLRGRLPPGE